MKSGFLLGICLASFASPLYSMLATLTLKPLICTQFARQCIYSRAHSNICYASKQKHLYALQKYGTALNQKKGHILNKLEGLKDVEDMLEDPASHRLVNESIGKVVTQLCEVNQNIYVAEKISGAILSELLTRHKKQ